MLIDNRGKVHPEVDSPNGSGKWNQSVIQKMQAKDVGKVVLRDKEHLVALRAYQRGLVMHQLRYLDEIRPMDEIEGIDAPQNVDAKELSLGKALVDNLSVEKFDPGQYSDTYAKGLEKLKEAKSKGQQITIKEEELPSETDQLLKGDVERECAMNPEKYNLTDEPWKCSEFDLML
jgi:non-homologous end joining protein Ku